MNHAAAVQHIAASSLFNMRDGVMHLFGLPRSLPRAILCLGGSAWGYLATFRLLPPLLLALDSNIINRDMDSRFSLFITHRVGGNR